jgi:hypothetical protein
MSDETSTATTWVIRLILFVIAAGFLILVIIKAGSLGP